MSHTPPKRATTTTTTNNPFLLHHSGVCLPQLLTSDSPSTEIEQTEDILSATALELQRIQNQIMVGEDTYVEESNYQYNIYKGWDGFIDVRDLSETTNNNRRLTLDQRWFSSGCTDYASFAQHGRMPTTARPEKVATTTTSAPTASSTTTAISSTTTDTTRRTKRKRK